MTSRMFDFKLFSALKYVKLTACNIQNRKTFCYISLPYTLVYCKGYTTHVMHGGQNDLYGQS